MEQPDLILPMQLSDHERAVIKKIVQAYPDYHFRSGTRFAFRPPRTIMLGVYEPHYLMLLCHELGHALSGKHQFTTDIKRLKIERDAWEQAKSLCAQFSIPYDTDFAENQLDSYRDWLHTKSKCKKCGLTRYQTKNGQYHCPHCDLTV